MLSDVYFYMSVQIELLDALKAPLLLTIFFPGPLPQNGTLACAKTSVPDWFVLTIANAVKR